MTPKALEISASLISTRPVEMAKLETLFSSPVRHEWDVEVLEVGVGVEPVKYGVGGVHRDPNHLGATLISDTDSGREEGDKDLKKGKLPCKEGSRWLCQQS